MRLFTFFTSCPFQSCVFLSEKRGDFKLMYNADGDEDRHCSAFHLLEQACLEMAEVSYKVHNSNITEVQVLSNGQRPLYRNFLYSRMLWGEWVECKDNCHSLLTEKLCIWWADNWGGGGGICVRLWAGNWVRVGDCGWVCKG